MDSQIMFVISSEEKEIIKKASKLIGLKTGSFIRSCSLEKARKILLDNQIDSNNH